MRTDDTLFWIWLSEALGASNRDFKQLIDLYRSPYEIFGAEESELLRVPRIAQRTVERLCDKSIARATDILELCERLGVGILPYTDPLFPPQLRELARPPVLLSYKAYFLGVFSKITVEYISATVGRAVVNDDYFIIFAVLRKQAFDAP